MNFTVWLDDEAGDDISDLFQSVPDPGAVGDAMIEARSRLAADPSQGRALSEGPWKRVVAPVAVFYEFDLAARTVKVTNVCHLAP